MILHQLKRRIGNDETKLALKIAVASFVIFITILTLIISSSYIYQRNGEYRAFQSENQMIDNTQSLTGMIPPLPPDKLGNLGERKHRGPRDIVIFDRENKIVRNDFIELSKRDIDSLLAIKSRKNRDIEIMERTYLVARSDVNNTTVFVFHDLTPLRDFHMTLIVIALLGSLLALIIIYLLARYLARIAIEPIREQSRELEAYSHNVAHELRTPLSVMRGNMELLGMKMKHSGGISQKQEIRGSKIFSKVVDGDVSDGETHFSDKEIPRSSTNEVVDEIACKARSFSDIHRFIISTDEEITGMERIIESLLFLAKPDAGVTQTEINITTKTEEIIGRYTPENPIKYTSEKKHIHKIGSEELYTRILCNLIENAIKYKSGGDISIDLSKSGIKISNQIANIMSDNEISHLTKVFYQGDVSRNSTGYGLGLALVAKIVELSGWTMSIDARNQEFIVNISF